jgi:tRNA G37 N-methylase Trm5
MLVIMKKSADDNQLQEVKQYLVDHACDFHQSTGADRIIIGIVGKTDEIERKALLSMDGVLDVYKIPQEE